MKKEKQFTKLDIFFGIVLLGIVLFRLYVVYMIRTDHIFWLQPYTVYFIPTLLTTFIFLVLLIYSFLKYYKTKPEKYNRVIIVISFCLVMMFFMLQFRKIDAEYYQEDGVTIIAVENNGILLGDTTFYYQENGLFGKELGSCNHNISLRCEYRIEGNILFVNTYSGGEVSVQEFVIPESN